MSHKIELMATTTFGLEAVVKHELKNLGYEQLEVENGKITFEADLAAIPRANLWLRAADRVKWKIGEFKATSFEELFEKTKALPWAEVLPRDASFPVSGKSVKSKLFSVPDCQAITKKAIVENLKDRYKTEWFAEDGPEYKIEVALLKDRVTLSIDTSGAGLHKRGYRYYHTQAPMKETLAAGLIQLSRWKPDRPFVDPFCGSGTLPIEAALIGQNSAPGLNRSFASQYWPNISPQAWEGTIEEALDLENPDQKMEIYGRDHNGDAIKLAAHNAQKAGAEEKIHFKQQAFKDLVPDGKYGYLMCNPPYGERLSEQKAVETLYQQMGKQVREHWSSWSIYVFTAHTQFEKRFGQKANKRRKLYSGNIRCDLYQYFGPRPPR